VCLFSNFKILKNTIGLSIYLSDVSVFLIFVPGFFHQKKQKSSDFFQVAGQVANCTKKLARPLPLRSHDMNSAKSVAASGVLRKAQ
jgi:hypothetical protein